MAYVIAKPCIGVKDTACVTICPVDCIHPTKDESAFAAAEQLYIDARDCIHCGLCVDECPVKAIFAEEDVPAEWVDYIEKNASYFRSTETGIVNTPVALPHQNEPGGRNSGS